jgi:hypothetical protein
LLKHQKGFAFSGRRADALFFEYRRASRRQANPAKAYLMEHPPEK